MIRKDDFDGNIKFGGKEFHTSTARNKLIESIVEGKEGKLFFDCKDNTLTPKDKYFEDISTCILCGSNLLLPLVERNGLKVSRCQECGLGMQNPRFKADRVHEIYEDTYCMDNTYSSINAVELDKIKFMYGIQEARKINNYITSVLDVG